MKQSLLFLSAVLLAGGLFAFEPSTLNLRVPSHLDRNALVLDVQHRVKGILTEETLDNFFGIDQGANINFGIRYALLPRLEVKACYTTLRQEYRLGASYAHHIPQVYLKGQVDVEYFDFERSGERNSNFYYGLALQSYPLGGILTPTVNLAYDGFNEKFGFGFGIDLGFDWYLGPIEHVSVIGEYYPILDSEPGITAAENYFAAGLRLDTYGHHFMVQVSNGFEIGPRNLMLGVPTNDLYLGFNIQRILQF
jgi:hypothetical protein